MLRLCTLFLVTLPLGAQQWIELFNGRNLDGWEVRGDSIWTVLEKDRVLIGQRPMPGGDPFGPWPVTADRYRHWLYQQSWLYTRREFGSYDLHVEYWVPVDGNSGVSIRDTSRARYTFGSESGGPSPAHIGYEIQIIGSDNQRYPSGSIYLFAPARKGVQRMNDWNTLEIESRPDRIAVRLNGQLVAEHPGDPKRPKTGPIGLQLHDRFSFALFRNIRIRER